jgi:sporulation protein YqfC
MNLLDKLRDYVDDNELVVHVYRNKLNIVNYQEIAHFSNSKIIIKHSKGSVTIIGSKLVVSKLIDNELLVNGDIKTIELG